MGRQYHPERLISEKRHTELPPKELLESLGDFSGAVCADIGCGSGFFTVPWSRLIGEDGLIYAVDPSEEMLSTLRGRIPSDQEELIETIQTQGDSIPIGSAVCDHILISMVLHGLEHPEGVIDEAVRVLKPGGRMFILEWEYSAADEHHRISEGTIRTLLEHHPAEITKIRKVSDRHILYTIEKAEEDPSGELYTASFAPVQETDLTSLKLSGKTLDVGGGGEGIIGMLAPELVTSIDISEEELLEAPEGPVKIVMDASAMTFEDDSFSTVVCFYSLMFMSHEIHQQVINEIFRVLKPGGTLHIFESCIPEPPEGHADAYIIPVHITLEDLRIETAYGTVWEGSVQDGAYYADMLRTAGFQDPDLKQEGQRIHITAAT